MNDNVKLYEILLFNNIQITAFKTCMDAPRYREVVGMYIYC